MPLARAFSVALVSVTGHVVEVEVDIANGLVGMILVGLPDTALREARDRIHAAIVNSGEQWPQRKITVALSPASLPKRGSWFDLAIAVGLDCRKLRMVWPSSYPIRAAGMEVTPLRPPRVNRESSPSELVMIAPAAPAACRF